VASQCCCCCCCCTVAWSDWWYYYFGSCAGVGFIYNCTYIMGYKLCMYLIKAFRNQHSKQRRNLSAYGSELKTKNNKRPFLLIKTWQNYCVSPLVQWSSSSALSVWLSCGLSRFHLLALGTWTLHPASYLTPGDTCPASSSTLCPSQHGAVTSLHLNLSTKGLWKATQLSKTTIFME